MPPAMCAFPTALASASNSTMNGSSTTRSPSSTRDPMAEARRSRPAAVLSWEISLAEVRYEGVYKLFGDDAVVENLNLHVADGEFLVLVGPSGCGKTTSLRMLAGFGRPAYGRGWIDDAVVNTVPPKARDIAMVFQSYALFPHMTVRQN